MDRTGSARLVDRCRGTGVDIESGTDGVRRSHQPEHSAGEARAGLEDDRTGEERGRYGDDA